MSSDEKSRPGDAKVPSRQADLGHVRLLLDEAIGLLDKHGLSVAAAYVSHAIEKLDQDI